MKKFIVTTTINPPTKAFLKFAEMQDWTMIVVGDLKTPHSDFENKDWIYLSPSYQEENFPELSEAIGWNCIMRRNFGFIEAYKRGADVVASVDDDNIPYDEWGKDLIVGEEVTVPIYDCITGVLDPMKLTNHKELWHRGYPIDRLYESKYVEYVGERRRKVLIQASLWDGDPDVDALCRLTYAPKGLELTIEKSFSSNNYIPFNSQNTFIAREVLPCFMMLPHIGRCDDIWGGYLAQFMFDTRPVFTKATVYQERNEQSVLKNLEDELFGYKNTSSFLNSLVNRDAYLPKETFHAYKLYCQEYDK